MRSSLKRVLAAAVLAVLVAVPAARAAATVRLQDDGLLDGGEPGRLPLTEDFKGQAIAAAPAPEAKAAAAAAALAEEAATTAAPPAVAPASSAEDGEGDAALGCPAEPYRPLVHFTPRSQWMNDPNGLLFADGEWHLFFQFNPLAAVPANISWGHAVSRDLLRWTELSGSRRAAIPFDADKGELIFSGSAVLDKDNTSGLGTTENPPMVAIYTSHYLEPRKEAQSLAYSLDSGRTWTKLRGNPVLDEGLPEFRDPKVQWHAPTRRWLMAVALPNDRKIRFYSSPDLKAWTQLSDFGPMGAVGGQYECPDLFPLPVDGDLAALKWVLVVNVNPGGLQGGSSAQYFIGDFDGERFVPDDNDPAAVRWLDYGKDYYAAVSWVGAPDGQRYMIGWMSNWQYSAQTPTAPWRNAMSVPRVVALRRRADGGLDLLQTPVPALATTLRAPGAPRPAAEAGEAVSAAATAGAVLVARGCGGAFLLDAKLRLRDGATRASLLVRAADDGSAGTAIVLDAEKGELAVDRRLSGRVDFSEDFPGVHAAPVTLVDGQLRVLVLVDEASVEVFADGGRVAVTDTIFPDEANQAVVLKVEGPDAAAADLADVRITPLRSYRPECDAAPVAQTCRFAG